MNNLALLQLNSSKSWSRRKSNQESTPQNLRSLRLNSIVAPTLIPIQRPKLLAPIFHLLLILARHPTHSSGLLYPTRMRTQWFLRRFPTPIHPSILPTIRKWTGHQPRTTLNNIFSINGLHRRPIPAPHQQLRVVKPHPLLRSPTRTQQPIRRQLAAAPTRLEFSLAMWIWT